MTADSSEHTPPAPQEPSLDDCARLAAMAAAVASPRFSRLEPAGGAGGILHVLYRTDGGEEYQSGYAAPAWVFRILGMWPPKQADPQRRDDDGQAAMTTDSEERMPDVAVGGPPAVHSTVHRTAAGTPYLRAPGVVLIAAPAVDISGMAPFLEGFDAGLGFSEYVHDTPVPGPGARLVKTAGQVCYASWGPRRTHNADAARYIRHLVDSGHESVLEHACYSLLIYGVSRSLTHELARHRFLSISQLSQRYVSGAVLRFVERPEFQRDPELHALFERRIDRTAAEHRALADALRVRQQASAPGRDSSAATDRRKRVQQAARALLPNETETVLAATANARAWRWILRLRGSEHAEPEIRALAVRALLCLQRADPMLFGDLATARLADGAIGVRTDR